MVARNLGGRGEGGRREGGRCEGVRREGLRPVSPWRERRRAVRFAHGRRRSALADDRRGAPARSGLRGASDDSGAARQPVPATASVRFRFRRRLGPRSGDSPAPARTAPRRHPAPRRAPCAGAPARAGPACGDAATTPAPAGARARAGACQEVGGRVRPSPRGRCASRGCGYRAWPHPGHTASPASWGVIASNSIVIPLTALPARRTFTHWTIGRDVGVFHATRA